MPETLRVLAGDCTVVETNGDRHEHRGRVVALTKPDNTVLVHDAAGYQPVAWLTRADAVTVSRTDGRLVARKDGDTLRVFVHDEDGAGAYPASDAGVPVGDCPHCAGTLVRAKTSVGCTDCGDAYSLPRDATVRDDRCDCGLPRLRVERGTAFDVCLDRGCESIDDAVAAAFDGAWDCPECDAPLRILRRGGLIAGCERYPDCDTGFAIPAGTAVNDCDCGLPVFETATGRRCLDSTCEAASEATPTTQ